MSRVVKGGALAAAIALALLPSRAQAYVYWTRQALVESFFGAAPVASVEFQPTPAEVAAIKATLGYRLPRPRYELLVGTDPGARFAVIDDQLGQHEPITFAVLLDEAVTVRRIEIMVYREAYGDGVRAELFRGQFAGLGLDSPMRPGKEIRIVSGATISTRAIAMGTRRACALVRAYLDRSALAEPEAPPAPPADPSPPAEAAP